MFWSMERRIGGKGLLIQSCAVCHLRVNPSISGRNWKLLPILGLHQKMTLHDFVMK